MKEDRGDLWTYPAEYRCITTNGVVVRGELVMGRGVALQAKIKFPTLPAKLARWVKAYGNRPFLCVEERILTFPTKQHWKDNSSLDLIITSARLLVAMVDKFAIDSVSMPRPGCGNGNLDWRDVGIVITDILDDRFVVLTTGRHE